MQKQQLPQESSPDILSVTYWRKFAQHRLTYIILACLFSLGIILTFGPGKFGGNGGGGQSGDEGASKDATIATVNDVPITRMQYENGWAQVKNSQFGRMYVGNEAMTASGQGMVLGRMITTALQQGAAKKKGLTVSDSDIDKAIAEIKTNMGKDGKPVSDSEFEQLLSQQGVTMAQVREDFKQSLLPKILAESIGAGLKLTDVDLEKSFDEVKVRRILIPVLDLKSPQPGSMPDGQAQKRIEDILAKIKGGMDFAKAADQYTADPSNTNSETDKISKKTVKTKLGGLMNANSGYPKADQGWYRRGSYEGDEFDNAAFALKKGEMTGVVKTTRGYQIIKLEDTRRNLPKDYVKNKPALLKSFKEQKASKPLQDLMDAEKKAAKIVWKDPQFQWRNDYAEQSGNPMMGQFTVPSKEDQDKLLAELRAYAPKHPEDGGANLVLAGMLEKNLQMTTGSKLDDPARNKIRDEVISSYELALKKTEDKEARFKLVQLYHESKRDDKALEHLTAVDKQLSYDKDPSTRFIYQQLSMQYRNIGKPDLAAKADATFAELNAIAAKDAKEKADAQKASQVPAPKAPVVMPAPKSGAPDAPTGKK